MENDVQFKQIEEDDLEMIRKWRSSPDVSQYMYTDGEITPEQQVRWFERIQQEEDSRYWIIEFQGKKLGVVYLIHLDPKNSKCYWGFYLGDLSVRGQGIGGKVEYKVLEYVFEELKLNKLYAEVFSFNEKVVKMHEKYGFRREGYLRQHIQKNDKFYDVITIGLLKTEWDQLKDSLYKKVKR